MRALFLFLLCSLPFSIQAATLRAGQVWAYHTRPGEESSTLTILKIEDYQDLGKVVHIRVDGINITNPTKANTVSELPHLPFKEAALQKSITQLLRQVKPVPDFKRGYDYWKKAYLEHHASAFNVGVASMLDGMYKAEWVEEK